MGVQEAMARLAQMMDRECPKGRESKRLERRLKAGRGYVSKLRGKGWNTSIQRLLEVAEALEIPSGVFFGRVFDVPTDPESRLRAIERECGETPALKRLERATWKLEREERPMAVRSPQRLARLEDLTRSSRSDQRKRLRSTLKYHTPEFMRRYLEHLDRLRYEQADTAAWIAEFVATEIVELVVCQRTERLELQCQALGVLASAQRLLGNFTPAARSIRLGLELARRQKLGRSTAELLVRGAYVLGDQGEYGHALSLLEKAQLIYFDSGTLAASGKVLVVRGIMLGHQKNYSDSRRIFERALEMLPDKTGGSDVWHLTAVHGTAIADFELGDFRAAKKVLASFIDAEAIEKNSVAVKLKWLRGRIALAECDHEAAEVHLLETLRLSSLRDHPLQVALVSLDLISALLACEKAKEAASLAKQMSTLIGRFQGNKIADGALMQLAQAGIEGQITQALLDEVRARFSDGRSQDGIAPSVP